MKCDFIAQKQLQKLEGQSPLSPIPSFPFVPLPFTWS